MIYWSGSQDSGKHLILLVYYKESVPLRNSKCKRCPGQGSPGWGGLKHLKGLQAPAPPSTQKYSQEALCFITEGGSIKLQVTLNRQPFVPDIWVKGGAESSHFNPTQVSLATGTHPEAILGSPGTSHLISIQKTLPQGFRSYVQGPKGKNQINISTSVHTKNCTRMYIAPL